MQTVTRSLAAAIVFAALAGAALAAPPDAAAPANPAAGWGMGMMGGHGGGMGMGGLVRFADAGQVDALKQTLAIKPAQEDAWSAYAKALQSAAETSRSLHQGMDRSVIHQMSPDDRAAFMGQMRQQSMGAWREVSTAAATLYGALDDTQKAAAQQALPGLAGGCAGSGSHAMRGMW